MSRLAPLAERTRLGLRHMARSVSIVTLRWEGERYAMAATAVEGLSLDPPAMLVCVNKGASLATPMAGGADFCINVLGLSHKALPAQCSNPVAREERFSTADWIDTERGTPCLLDAQVRFLCAYEQLVEYGTHFMVIGRILDVVTADAVEPLVHANGSYHRLHCL